MLDASGITHSVSVYTTVNVVPLVALENSQALSCWRAGPRNPAKGLRFLKDRSWVVLLKVLYPAVPKHPYRL